MSERLPSPAAAPDNAPVDGWTTPEPATLPQPTYWPMVMAAGIILLLWGLVTTWAVAAVGAGLFALALAGWIGALRHEAE